MTPPAPQPAPAPVKKTVRGQLLAYLQAGLIDQATHDRYVEIDRAARATRKKLKGARRQALGITLKHLDDTAKRGALTVSRLPAFFETVRRNRQWWTEGPLLGNGKRVMFPSSQLVWQYYSGQGLQIQWLGTFGRANGLWSYNKDTQLRSLLDEASGLAAARAGGTAFEYLFSFNGGRPPWASGLAQGTALQAFSRGAVRLGNPNYFNVARSLLGIYRTPPPEGVRVASGPGAHYLIYTFASKLKVLNAFTQAVNGLHDFAVLANDPEGKALYAQGDAALRAELPTYDTGGWSKYSLQRDSDIGYHKLARDFLRNLCQRQTEDRTRADGGPLPGADPAPYCGMAQRFTADLTAKPKIALVTARVRANKRQAVRFTVDKPANVSLAFSKGGRVASVLRSRVDSGRRSFTWRVPKASGTYKVVVRATDLLGNGSVSTGTLRVLRSK